MVQPWTQAGRPHGQRQHRCNYWAQIVGGILEANGFTCFLGNQDEAAAEFNVALVELGALAEAVITLCGPFTVSQDQVPEESGPADTLGSAQALRAGDWVRYFQHAHLGDEQLGSSASQHSKSTYCGKYLGKNVGKRVPIVMKNQA